VGCATASLCSTGYWTTFSTNWRAAIMGEPSPVEGATSAETPQLDTRALVTDEPLDAARLEAWAATSADGAVVTFRGIVRDHDHGAAVQGLDYRAHPDAEEMLQATCARVSETTGVRLGAAHRTGALAVGDLALVAVAAAPHRAEAFAALSALVEAIKRDVPIWKRQHLADGSTEWVGL
jgi:molybdopterin synthase catalytic subunit